MTDKQQRRENDALQSGEGDLAYGQDARTFGAGGQREVSEPTPEDMQSRDVTRDRSLDPAHQSAASDKTTRGTYRDPQNNAEDKNKG
ncbi:hypothetical protein [Altericroceibacterium xinjiangense]|uniref:hypothetical protein n=1 Tax=Altericroceibacterium xinjiangense TaxID=762261 RepID=UPI000F7DD1D0|nr:hypothetical protein [Altericroceibacterium xinjiangense]